MSAPLSLVYELGLWLSGLRAYLDDSGHAFIDRNSEKNAARDFTKEFRLTHSALMICSRLNYKLRTSAPSAGEDLKVYGGADAIVNYCDDLNIALCDAIVLNRGLIRAEPLKFEEWKAWNGVLSEKLRSSPVYDIFVDISDDLGTGFLPLMLRSLLADNKLTFEEEADLHNVMPRFAQILRALSIVGRMLRDDEPLKPSLLIFARVYSQTHELIAAIDNRLARFQNDEAELFRSLDGASYTAALELKKVYQQELTGLVSMRPAPSIFARIETAYALLNDSFQQILAGFARLMDDSVTTAKMFPHFDLKMQQSLALRTDLTVLLDAAKNCESSPDKASIEKLNKVLSLFLGSTMRFLFYKDKETVKRFAEEISAADEKKDLVPVVHRFSAYLETLIGQVSMRNVLAGHPQN